MDEAGNISEDLITDSILIEGAAGDINQDGVVNADDIDALCRGIRGGSNDPRFDINGDGTVDKVDFRFFINDVLNTHLGDSNLDGRFESGDLVQVFTRAEYEDNIPNNSGWADGDWNCDGDFDSGDLVDAFQEGAYIAAATDARVFSRVLITFDQDTIADFAANRQAIDHVKPRAAPKKLAVEADDDPAGKLDRQAVDLAIELAIESLENDRSVSHADDMIEPSLADGLFDQVLGSRMDFTI
jgi:hypothetical protein